jgi:hypothetical protein
MRMTSEQGGIEMEACPDLSVSWCNLLVEDQYAFCPDGAQMVEGAWCDYQDTGPCAVGNKTATAACIHSPPPTC